MPKKNWSQLSKQQIGRYAEYYAKMEFTSYGMEVYTSEVDDHGVDFVAKDPRNNHFYEVQVKAARKAQQIFISEDKMPVESLEHRLVCFLYFRDAYDPDFYVIPGTAWKNPTSALAHYRYDKPGQKSAPEWSIHITEKNLLLLEQYRAENMLG